jgi:hypothetical protein
LRAPWRIELGLVGAGVSPCTDLPTSDRLVHQWLRAQRAYL